VTRILLAPDKFKGSLTAVGVVEALARGLTRARPDLDVVRMPVADGGDGTVEAAISGGMARVAVRTTGPTGLPVDTAFARRDGAAILELADACGLLRLPGGRPAPLTASSRGLGTVIAAAVDAGCTDLVVGIGGSASSDGGAGMLAALGARLLDADGHEVPGGAGALHRIASIDTRPLTTRLAGVRITMACDVDNPLLGPDGASAVYGPQKGARPEDVERIDDALRHWADVVARTTGTDLRDAPGAGAAGGVGFGALSLLGATLSPGADLVLDLVGLPAALRGADVVVTGEGSLDEQSLRGKVPARIAQLAAAGRVPAYVVCGRSQLSADQLAAAGITAVLALVDREPDLQRCLTDAAALLERVGEEIARTV
jgi:glycerate kinase